ncbi:NADP-dependent oxidoreductase domain-containing protein [Infundibulicybe gibba]|nr:NADP-dependent oxidoreductase domain-containing protein [Infundibulicybe gibba]
MSLMPYVRLGSSGLKVSKIILGCMSYGTPAWQKWMLEEEESLEHIKAAYDLGINTYDTADFYSGGLSEVILGKAIKKYQLPRDEIVVMTKVYFARNRDPSEILAPKTPQTYSYVNQRGLSRKHIFDAVKQSLERLQLDYIDVLQCHRFDPDTPISETMQALHDVVQAGYVRYIGMSSCFAWQFHAMQNYAINNKLTPFISLQNHYNLLYREEEREMMPTLKHLGVGSIPWSPLARGLLARPIGSEEGTRSQSDPHFKGYNADPIAINAIINVVEGLSKKKGVSMAQVSLAWLLHQEGVTAPVIGTTSIEKLQDLAAAVHLELSKEEIADLEAPYKPQPIYGH